MVESLDSFRARAVFYTLMKKNKFSEACELLLENPSAIDGMKVSEFTGYYRTLYSNLPIGKLGGLTTILKERIFVKDTRLVLP